MSLVYADTSALVRAYLADEEDHDLLRASLLESGQPVVTSEISRVEFASATTAATRAGRLRSAELLLRQFDLDCGAHGPVSLLRLDPARILPLAFRLVREHAVRTLDAIHVAVATDTIRDLLPAGGSVLFVTRDDRQATAAVAVGLEVR